MLDNQIKLFFILCLVAQTKSIFGGEVTNTFPTAVNLKSWEAVQAFIENESKGDVKNRIILTQNCIKKIYESSFTIISTHASETEKLEKKYKELQNELEKTRTECQIRDKKNQKILAEELLLSNQLNTISKNIVQIKEEIKHKEDLKKLIIMLNGLKTMVTSSTDASNELEQKRDTLQKQKVYASLAIYVTPLLCGAAYFCLPNMFKGNDRQTLLLHYSRYLIPFIPLLAASPLLQK